MTQTNPKWQRLPEWRKWLVRLGISLGAVYNGWEYYRHMADHNPVVAIIDAAFVVLCIWFILQSF